MLTLVKRECTCQREWRGASITPTSFAKTLGYGDRFLMYGSAEEIITGGDIDEIYIYQGVNIGGEFWRFIWKNKGSMWSMADGWDVINTGLLQKVADGYVTEIFVGYKFRLERTRYDLIFKATRV